jgi:hypothetical protein
MLCLAQVGVRAAGELPDKPENKKWNVDGNTATIVVDAAADIPVLLDKSVLSGRNITIQSDAKYVSLTTESLPRTHITLTVAPGEQKADSGDGSTSTLKFVAGTSPALAFNGKGVSTKDSIQWTNIAKSADTTVTLEIINATFAKITFETPMPTPPVSGAHAAAPTTRAVPVLAASKELLVPAAKVQYSIDVFSKSACRPCSRCRGSGQISEEYQDGWQQAGAFQKPIMKTRDVTCPLCHGDKVERDNVRVLLVKTQKMIQSLLAMDPADKNADDAKRTLYSTVTKQVIGDETTWDKFAKDADETLSMSKPTLDRAIIAEVKILKQERGSDGKRTYTAQLAGTRDSTVKFLIVDPPSADNVSGGYALMGGLIGKSVVPHEGANPIVSVTGAFLIVPKVEKNRTWWFNAR